MPTMPSYSYVHGYDGREGERLVDQASTLTALLHHDTAYPAGSRVLEAGCGVGAQTVALAKNSPDARITAVDISAESLDAARRRTTAEGITNVEFHQADLFDLPFPPASFDHIFVCFVLEHLPAPETALQVLKKLLREGGTITVIEGDHGSAFFHPEDADARASIQCLVDLQRMAGGEALIGRQLYPLLCSAGYRDARVSPRFVYADASRPTMVDGFTRKTFTAMVEGVRDRALEAGLVDENTWDRGVAALHRCAEPDGVFCYTFFKGVAQR
jgi:SAM-dependent methyltransferase